MAENRESWLGTLHLVTLKHSQNSNFSICDEIFEPLELIHIAYLLSTAVSNAISANSASAISPQKTPQNKLKQKSAQHSQNTAKISLYEGTSEIKGFPDDDRIISATVQLQIIVRRIFLSYPEFAYDALLVLSEMQRESRKLNSVEGERITVTKNNGGENFLDICVFVVHPLSMCDICCDNSDRLRESKDHLTSADGSGVAAPALKQAYEEEQRRLYYRSALQDSMLQILLEADDVLGVAALLSRWKRLQDLQIFADRIWSSVQFLLGEHEQKEEYYSDAAWGTVRVRRPVPVFEAILDIAHLDQPDGFLESSEAEVCGLEGKERGTNGNNEVEVNVTKLQRARIDQEASSTTEENKTEKLPPSSSSETETVATPGLSPKLNALPPNSNMLLRRRLLQLAAIQQFMSESALPP